MMSKFYFLATCLLSWPVGLCVNKQQLRSWLIASAVVGFWGEVLWCWMGDVGQWAFCQNVFGGLFAGFGPEQPEAVDMDGVLIYAQFARDKSFGGVCAFFVTIAALVCSIFTVSSNIARIREGD